MSSTRASSLEPALDALLAELDQAASDRDVERFLAPFLDGPELAFAVGGRVLETIDEICAMHRASWAKFASVRFKSTPRRVVRVGDLAVITASGEAQRVGADGTTSCRAYAVTLVVARRDGRWRVLQAHESSPATPGP